MMMFTSLFWAARILSAAVKFADIKDNLDITRLGNVPRTWLASVNTKGIDI